MLVRSKFQLSTDVTILLDNVNNDFDRVFAVWPERYYCVRDSLLSYVAAPTTEFGFDREDLTSHIYFHANAVHVAKEKLKPANVETVESAPVQTPEKIQDSVNVHQ